MTRDEYIKAVKAKLEEISPFDEPINEDGKQGFIAADGDPDYQEVKPIVSYIESELDNSARYCLESLPLSLLSSDVTSKQLTFEISNKGVGRIADMYNYFRFVRLACDEFERDVTAFITSASPLYLLQQNEHTRGGVAKPVACYTPERGEIELFSFPKDRWEKQSECILYFIDCKVKLEQVQSPIEEYIISRCALSVARILGGVNEEQLISKFFVEDVEVILN